MIGTSRQANVQPGDTNDPLHDPDRDLLGFQDRTLLDMEFQVASRYRWPCRRIAQITDLP
jgi:hypothetical protein